MLISPCCRRSRCYDITLRYLLRCCHTPLILLLLAYDDAMPILLMPRRCAAYALCHAFDAMMPRYAQRAALRAAASCHVV